ncbi:MAG: hypothetical protein Q9174_004463 [Haloplaca sp. 1 TL-2023]
MSASIAYNSAYQESAGTLSQEAQYIESYSESGSSNSSFSYGLLTPTSTVDFSAAVSRRHSVASDNHMGSGNSFERGHSLSSHAGTTSFKGPSSHHRPSRSARSRNRLPATPGYDFGSSPTEPQFCHRSNVDLSYERPHFRNPFAPQTPYVCGAAASALEVAIHEEDHPDIPGLESRSISNKLLDWPAYFEDLAGRNCSQADWNQDPVDFGFDPSTRLDLVSDHPGLLPSPGLLNFGMVNGTPPETSLPQTIAPQETFVYPSSSLSPSTPVSDDHESVFQTPATRSGVQSRTPMRDEFPSPAPTVSEDESPSKVKCNNEVRRAIFDAIKRQSPPAQTGSNKRKRKSVVKTEIKTECMGFTCDFIPTASSANKLYLCEHCNLRFERPEHRNRHNDTIVHRLRLEELNMKPANEKAGTKKWPCEVPKCHTRVTRMDNLKPHYQKTHFYVKYVTDANGHRYEDAKGKRKRNEYVSPEEAVVLGMGDWDPRTPEGQSQIEATKSKKSQRSKQRFD